MTVRWSLVVLYAAVLVFTRTRTELAILVAAGVVLFGGAARRSPITVPLLIVGALSAAMAYLFAAEPIAQFLARNQSAVSIATLTGRTIVWSDAIAVWWQHPITGLGYYSGHRFGLNLGPGAVEFSNIDNMWLETLLDTGILGFLPLSIFVIVAARQVWRLPGSGPATTARRALLVAGILASLINPSLQTNGYGMILLGAVLLGAPRPGTGLVASSGAADLAVVGARKIDESKVASRRSGLSGETSGSDLRPRDA
jgi:O-antigen ligase